MATKKKTQKQRLLNVLDSAYYGLPTRTLAKRINAPEPSVRRLIGELRLAGYPVIRDTTNNTYFIGDASTEIISFAAEVGGASLFRVS